MRRRRALLHPLLRFTLPIRDQNHHQTDEAKSQESCYILRVVNGRQARLPFDYEAVLRGQKAEQNLRLQPGDTVVVPR